MCSEHLHVMIELSLLLYFKGSGYLGGALLVALAVKNLPANAGDLKDAGSVPGSGRSPRGGHGSPLQYSCLENPMDRGAWRATVPSVVKSRTRLNPLAHMHITCSQQRHS